MEQLKRERDLPGLGAFLVQRTWYPRRLSGKCTSSSYSRSTTRWQSRMRRSSQDSRLTPPGFGLHQGAPVLWRSMPLKKK